MNESGTRRRGRNCFAPSARLIAGLLVAWALPLRALGQGPAAGRTLAQPWASFLVSLEREAPAPSAGGKQGPHEIPAGKGEILLHLGEVKLKVFTYRPTDYDPKHG